MPRQKTEPIIVMSASLAGFADARGAALAGLAIMRIVARIFLDEDALFPVQRRV